MNKKLIFFDIDGTLVSHVGKSHVPEPTIRAVRELAGNGHVPAIATGRNLALTRKTAAFFGIGIVVCCNGAHVTCLKTGRYIHESWLCDDFVRAFITWNSAGSERAYAFDAEHVYTDWERDFPDSFIAEEGGADCKKELTAMKRAQLAYIFSRPPKAWLERDDVDAIETYGCTEFHPRGVSKWSGIVYAAADCGFGPEDIITIGDGHNDLEMVENASVGIAVGGASDSLKAVADVVADDIDEGGIYSVFRSLGML